MCELLTVYLSVRGENPKDHAVRQELVTVRCERTQLISWWIATIKDFDR